MFVVANDGLALLAVEIVAGFVDIGKEVVVLLDTLVHERLVVAVEVSIVGSTLPVEIGEPLLLGFSEVVVVDRGGDVLDACSSCIEL